jgi:hypothetical protein
MSAAASTFSTQHQRSGTAPEHLVSASQISSAPKALPNNSIA